MAEPFPTHCFLDTCIYYCYAAEWDLDTRECRRVIDSKSYLKHTSLTVKSELDEFERDMERFLKFVMKSGSITKAISQETNRNRKAFLEGALHSLGHLSDVDALSALRLLIATIKETIKEALMMKTLRPLISPSKDDLLIESLSFLKNRNDCQIVADAAEWAQTNDVTLLFLTKDRKDILDNSRQIIRILNTHY